jgi:hypothetical protein
MVDEIVVDNENEHCFWGATVPLPASKSGSDKHTGTGQGTGTGGIHGFGQSDGSSYRGTTYESTTFLWAIVNYLRWRLWPVILYVSHMIFQWRWKAH